LFVEVYEGGEICMHQTTRSGLRKLVAGKRTLDDDAPKPPT
jgi:hypothetical protein